MCTLLVVKVTHTLALYKNGDSPAITTSIRMLLHIRTAQCVLWNLERFCNQINRIGSVPNTSCCEHTHFETQLQRIFHVKGSFESVPQNNNKNSDNNNNRPLSILNAWKLWLLIFGKSWHLVWLFYVGCWCYWLYGFVFSQSEQKENAILFIYVSRLSKHQENSDVISDGLMFMCVCAR